MFSGNNIEHEKLNLLINSKADGFVNKGLSKSIS